MTDYKKLVEALRCKRDDCEGCDLAFLDNDEGWMCQYAAKDDDAADAIEALQAEQKKTVTQIFGEEQQKWTEYCTALGNRIKELEQQMPKRGEWKTTRPDAPMFGFYYCSICGRRRTSPQDNYCPNCGADMRAKMEVQDGKSET